MILYLTTWCYTIIFISVCTKGRIYTQVPSESPALGYHQFVSSYSSFVCAFAFDIVCACTDYTVSSSIHFSQFSAAALSPRSSCLITARTRSNPPFYLSSGHHMSLSCITTREAGMSALTLHSFCPLDDTGHVYNRAAGRLPSSR